MTGDNTGSATQAEESFPRTATLTVLMALGFGIIGAMEPVEGSHPVMGFVGGAIVGGLLVGLLRGYFWLIGRLLHV